MEEQPIHDMAESECWEALRSHEFGRMAYHLVDEVSIVPLNYAVDGERLIFRTAPGSKLLGVVMNTDVAFEIDDFSGDVAWSVIAHGCARVLDGEEARAADNLPLRPWVDTPKYNVVAIEVNEISGRRFDLSRPWLHMRPKD